MKRFIRSYTNFTRPERNGLIGLCVLLAVVIVSKAVTRERINEVKAPQRIVAAHRQPAYRTGRQNDSFLKTAPKRKQPSVSELVNAFEESSWNEQSATNLPDHQLHIKNQKSFDPNTADSLTLRRFNLKPHTIANLMKWRAKGKRFYKAADLKPLYTLTTEEYNMLAPHIDIKRQQIDLNHADSITLLQLRGIGPKLAHKIIVRRNSVGPFTNHEQLRELYNFPDSVFEKLVGELIITP